MGERIRTVALALKRRGSATVNQIAADTGINRNTVLSLLRTLERRGAAMIAGQCRADGRVGRFAHVWRARTMARA